tara:strand:+ start:29 stop:253 length:225 start_codon:yes stop_codon:yes gene_type:complete
MTPTEWDYEGMLRDKDKELSKYELLLSSIAVLLNNKAITIKEMDELISNFHHFIEDGADFDWDGLNKKTNKYTH